MTSRKTKPEAQAIVEEIKEKLSDTSSAGKERKLAAMSYLFILCLVPLLSNKDSKFVEQHAKQGFVVMLLDIISFMLVWFPIFGQLFFVTMIIISVIGVAKALNGSDWEIPFIHDWSKKVKF